MIKWLTINKGINRVKPIQDSNYWTGVISDLDKQITDNQTAIAALVERKKPLCLSAHLGDRQALAQIEQIAAESRQLSAALPDLETAREQAQAAQQAEQHVADLARAELMRDATFARLELCERIDKAVSELTDLLLADIEQREKLSAITGIQFNHALTFGLAKSAIAFELMDRRGIRPDHYCLRMEFSDYRTTAANSLWCQGWIERVQQKIDQLIDGDPNYKSLSVEEIEVELKKAA